MKTKNQKIVEKPPLLKDVKFKQRYKQVESVIKKTEMGLERILNTKTLKEHSDVTGSFMIGVVMCLSSITLPATWFALVGYLKSYGIIDANIFTGILLGIGVLLGTSVWFYIMTKFISKHSAKIKPSLLNKLNIGTGIFLILLGVGILIKLATIYFQ